MLEIVVILALLVANGVFALAEIAIVSSRRARLQQRASRGDHGAAEALTLAAEPTRFLSTVQIGITLVGVLAGAFGGATLAARLAVPLRRVPWLAAHADGVALALVVGAITYLSLVIGELLPKRIALTNPESVASFVARPMALVARVASPLVRLLSASTEALMRLFRVPETSDRPVTAEEIAILLSQGERAGVFEASEHEIVDKALHLDELRVAAIATPRRNVVWIDAAADAEESLAKILSTPHAYVPVANGSLDAVVGVVRGRDVLAQRVRGEAVDLRAAAVPPLLFSETTSALDALERFRTAESHVALLVDEYGGIAGLLSMTDVVAALVGEIRSPGVTRVPAVEPRGDDAWSISGRLPIRDLCDLLDLRKLPEPGAGYETAAGLVMTTLSRVPAVGDRFELAGFVFEVERMDGLRIERILVRRASSPLPSAEPSTAATSAKQG